MKKLILGCALMSSFAFASGYKCQGEEGIHVKIFNQVRPKAGTRNPAVLVISDLGGTILVREGDEIRKLNRKDSTQYVVAGGQSLLADRAILTIYHKEGKDTVSAEGKVNGVLTLVHDDEAESNRLSCSRYLSQG